jgi:hypothetical protein
VCGDDSEQRSVGGGSERLSRRIRRDGAVGMWVIQRWVYATGVPVNSIATADET